MFDNTKTILKDLQKPTWSVPVGDFEEEWKKEFDDEIAETIKCEILYRYDTLKSAEDSADTVNKSTKHFISKLLDKEAKRRKREKLETAQVNFEAGKKAQILDVSTWKNMGEKYKYFDFFEKKNIIKEIDKYKKKVIPIMIKEDRLCCENGMDGIKGYDQALQDTINLIKDL